LVFESASKGIERVELEFVKWIVERALRHYENRYTKAHERISWGRLIAQCLKASVEVLRDSDLEDLVRRVELLEQSRALLLTISSLAPLPRSRFRTTITTLTFFRARASTVSFPIPELPPVTMQSLPPASSIKNSPKSSRFKTLSF
jgi:hypothetical protein